MLTVLLATARAPQCFTHHQDWNQFDVLARCLERQTYQDFELVVVTPFVEGAKQVLDGRVKSTVVPPRDTPWRRARMFAVASARNTGLVYTRGDWVFLLDDCCEFTLDLLERVNDWAQKGTAVAVIDCKANGTINDARWPLFEKKANGGASIILRGQDNPTPQGRISFPLAAAVAINGYDEHFDGARGLEDMNFSRRLMLHGVPFAMDRNITMNLHDHLGYPDAVIDNEDQNGRCCNTIHTLTRSGPANREQYTPDEKNKILHCMYWRDDSKCGYYNHASDCAYPKWAKNGHPVARDIMLKNQEGLFDLGAARRALTYNSETQSQY